VCVASPVPGDVLLRNAALCARVTEYTGEAAVPSAHLRKTDPHVSFCHTFAGISILVSEELFLSQALELDDPMLTEFPPDGRRRDRSLHK